MPVSDRRRILLITLIFLLALGTISALTYMEFSTHQDYTSKIALKRREAAQAQMKIKRIPALRKQAKALSEQVDRYAGILPREDEVSHDAFVKMIAQFARDLKIEILRADPIARESPLRRSPVRRVPQNTPKKEAFSEHSYHFELTGTFHSLLRFVNKIESWHRFLSVEEIEIRPLKLPTESRGTLDKEIESATNKHKSIELVVTTYTHTPKEPTVAAGQK